MSSSKKKSKKKQTKSKRTTNHMLPPSSTRIKVSLSSDSHKSNIAKKEKQRRPRSPLSPLRTWIHKSPNSPTKKSNSKKKSSEKKATKSTAQRRPRSHSNSFFDAKPRKYKAQTQITRPRTQTPNNTASRYNNYNKRNDPRQQLKFAKRNDKIIIDMKSKKYSKKKKKTNDNTSIAAARFNSDPPRRPRKKKQSFVERASLKLSHHIASPKTNRQRSKTPNFASSSKRSKSITGKKRGSFFSLNRDKTNTKSRSSSTTTHNSKHKKNEKSFKDKIFSSKSEKKMRKRNGFDVDIKKQHEKRSSLNMHKMRMIRALREEMPEDDIPMLSDDNSSSIEVVKLKHRDSKNESAHHKRGSSGIPSFFQKKLQFELRQYLDEKARLFIAHCMRMYSLRITEEIFGIISSFHVMPFDSGFICMTSDEYNALTSVSYHYPLVQLPASSMSALDGIHDDRLTEQSPHSMPLPNTEHPYSRSFDQKKKHNPSKMVATVPNPQVFKSRSAECTAASIALSQSESYPTPTVGDGFCDILDDAKQTKTAQDVIKKYKKKVHKKKKKDYNERKKKYQLKRSGSLDRKRPNLHNENLNNRIFYSSAPELSEDEAIDDFDDDADDDDFSQDGFPDLNYSQLLPFKHRMTSALDKEEETSGSMTYDSGRFLRNTPILNEDTPTIGNKVSELDGGYFGDINDDNSYNHRPASPPSDTMTPRTPTIEGQNFFDRKEFKLSFDRDDRQIHFVHKNEWNSITNGDNGLGIAEWTLLSTPKVFDFYNSHNINTVHGATGLGIGGFIDRTRGICDVSLAPIYYQYGGTTIDDRYYNKLDAYNLYTGDCITCSERIPFTQLYDTASSIVRTEYQSTLIISGGQIYGRDVFSDSQVQNRTFFYAPWTKSRYHDILSSDAAEKEFIIDKNGIINPSTPFLQKQELIRRKSFDEKEEEKNTRTRSRTSSQYRLNPLNFDNIQTRPASRSISHRHSNKQKETKPINKKSKQKEVAPQIAQRILSESGDWLRGPKMLRCRANHGSVAWDEHIVFCCGGFGSDGRRIANVEMLRMDKFTSIEMINALRWKKCAPMSTNKSNPVLIHWKPKTCIVSVGSGSKVVESYDPYKDNWKDLPPLNTHQISSKSCRFYYDSSNSQTNCLMFLKFRNGRIKSMEYLDERIKLKKWQLINDQYVDLFNAQIDNNHLQNIKPFCFA